VQNIYVRSKDRNSPGQASNWLRCRYVCISFLLDGKIFYVRLYFREALREEWDTGFPMLSIQTNSYAYNRKMIFPIDRWVCSISDYGFQYFVNLIHYREVFLLCYSLSNEALLHGGKDCILQLVCEMQVAGDDATMGNWSASGCAPSVLKVTMTLVYNIWMMSAMLVIESPALVVQSMR
jgi:hypothetical protein